MSEDSPRFLDSAQETLFKLSNGKKKHPEGCFFICADQATSSMSVAAIRCPSSANAWKLWISLKFMYR